MEKCYTVAETVKLTGVKSYVLVTGRMNFPFLFAEMSWGHRCYTQDDIQLF